MTTKIAMHPGEFLKSAYMEPLSINNQQVAEKIGVTQATISRLVNGKASVSVKMAIALGKEFNTSPKQWLTLQSEYDLKALGEKLGFE